MEMFIRWYNALQWTRPWDRWQEIMRNERNRRREGVVV